MSENKNVPSSLHYPKARVILGFLLMAADWAAGCFWQPLRCTTPWLGMDKKLGRVAAILWT